MKYEEIQDKLIDFLDQSLSEQEMKEIQDYIDQNKDFAQEVEEMKKIFWEGTEHWDTLLAERAVISGRLVLSDFTKETLKRFK